MGPVTLVEQRSVSVLSSRPVTASARHGEWAIAFEALRAAFMLSLLALGWIACAL